MVVKMTHQWKINRTENVDKSRRRSTSVICIYSLAARGDNAGHKMVFSVSFLDRHTVRVLHTLVQSLLQRFA